MVTIGNKWDDVLAGEFEKEYYQRLRQFLIREYRTCTVYPGMYDIFNALKATSYEEVKAVILGQDPYHEPGQAHGMSFSVRKGVKQPPSLVNIVRELKDELGIEDIKARYSGDYGDEDFGYGSYGYGAGGGYGARRSSGYGLYGNSAPRRVGRASDADEGAYRTFGSGRPAVRSAAKSATLAKKEPVRFGNVGVRPSPSGTGAANTAKAGADLSRFQEGARVRHPRFGEGVVTGVRGAGGNLIVTVHFETAGNKDLAAALAPLEVL